MARRWGRNGRVRVCHTKDTSLGGNAVGPNEAADASDEKPAARGAVRVFESQPTSPGRLPGKTYRNPGSRPISAARTIMSAVVSCVVAHAVVTVERGHVPRDVARDAGDERGERRELVVAVVEAGDDQGHDLHQNAMRARRMVSRIAQPAAQSR